MIYQASERTKKYKNENLKFTSDITKWKLSKCENNGRIRFKSYQNQKRELANHSIFSSLGPPAIRCISNMSV